MKIIDYRSTFKAELMKAKQTSPIATTIDEQESIRNQSLLRFIR